MKTWEIRITSGPLKGQKINILHSTTFGRKRADINLDDPKASSIHAQIQVNQAGQAYIVDQGSKNGTKLEGKPRKKILLQPGVVFQIGSTLMEVFEKASSSPQPSKKKDQKNKSNKTTQPPNPTQAPDEDTFDFSPKSQASGLSSKKTPLFNPYDVKEEDTSDQEFKSAQSISGSLFGGRDDSETPNENEATQTPNLEEEEWLSADIVLEENDKSLSLEKKEGAPISPKEEKSESVDDPAKSEVIATSPLTTIEPESEAQAEATEVLEQPTPPPEPKQEISFSEEDSLEPIDSVVGESEGSDPDPPPSESPDEEFQRMGAENAPLRDSTRVLSKAQTQTNAGESNDSTWQQILSEQVDQLEKKVSDTDTQTQAFSQVLQMCHVQGPQLNKVWYVGYGPRQVGPNSIDLPIYEQDAPEVCFELVPNKDGVEFKTDYPDKVLVNDKPTTSLILNHGDIIRIQETVIEVEFLL